MRFSVQGDYVFDRASFFFWPFCVKRKSVIDYDIATIRVDFYLNALSFIRKDTIMIEAGMKAPDFTLKDRDGNEVSLSSFLGKKVIIYFYPKDNTPGCTRQACAFAGAYEEFKNKNIEVIGISKDSVESHVKFAEKHGLPFILLSDPDLQAIQAYGVWQEKKMAGRTGMGVGGIENNVLHRDLGIAGSHLLFHFRNQFHTNRSQITGNKDGSILAFTAIQHQSGGQDGVMDALGNAQIGLAVNIHGFGGGNIPLRPTDFYGTHASSSAFISFISARVWNDGTYRSRLDEFIRH